MVQIFVLHRRDGRTETRSGPLLQALTIRFRGVIEDLRQAIQRARVEAELRRKLEGVDDHLLRDIGLRRDGDRLESTEPGRSLWGGTGCDR